MPNTSHCGISYGDGFDLIFGVDTTSNIDTLSLIVDWVENGNTPEIIEAEVDVGKKLVKVCPYPKKLTADKQNCKSQPLITFKSVYLNKNGPNFSIEKAKLLLKQFIQSYF